jgi:hypothetical protein
MHDLSENLVNFLLKFFVFFELYVLAGTVLNKLTFIVCHASNSGQD